MKLSVQLHTRNMSHMSQHTHSTTKHNPASEKQMHLIHQNRHIFQLPHHLCALNERAAMLIVQMVLKTFLRQEEPLWHTPNTLKPSSCHHIHVHTAMSKPTNVWNIHPRTLGKDLQASTNVHWFHLMPPWDWSRVKCTVVNYIPYNSVDFGLTSVMLVYFTDTVKKNTTHFIAAAHGNVDRSLCLLLGGGGV